MSGGGGKVGANDTLIASAAPTLMRIGMVRDPNSGATENIAAMRRNGHITCETHANNSGMVIASVCMLPIRDRAQPIR